MKAERLRCDECLKEVERQDLYACTSCADDCCGSCIDSHEQAHEEDWTDKDE